MTFTLVLAGETKAETPPRAPEMLAGPLREATFRYRAMKADNTIGDWQDQWTAGDRLPLQVEITLQDADGRTLAADGGDAAARGGLRGVGAVSRASHATRRRAAAGAVADRVADRVVGAFALTAKIEGLQGRVLHRGVIAEEVARAGFEYALTRVNDPDPRRQWKPDGRDYDWKFADADVQISLTDENGKIDLNQADLALLAALFQQQGAMSMEDARKLAAAVMDWRDPDLLTQPEGGAEDPDYASAERPYGAKDAPFESVAELEQVLGMTPALYAKVAPDLTVFSGRTRAGSGVRFGAGAAGDGPGSGTDDRAPPRVGPVVRPTRAGAGGRGAFSEQRQWHV